MTAFDPLDKWFEKGFRIRQQRVVKTAKRDKTRARSGSGLSSKGGLKFSQGAKHKNATSIVRKAPEVMVKITGSSKGLDGVKNHINYISRNGDVELTNEQGETLSGRADLKAFREQLKAAQIPNNSNKREFLHVIFSMPAGTPEHAMKKAVSDFCKEEFNNRRYVLALHDDTDHVHAHVCVGTRDIDRADEPRLSPRKADLSRWRQGFADKLREQGVEAAASERRHRFNYRRPEHHVVRQIRADNPKSAVYNHRRQTTKATDAAIRAVNNPKAAFVGAPRPPRVPEVVEAQKNVLKAALASGKRPVNPAQDNIERSRREVLETWREVKAALLKQGDNELANGVDEIIALGEQQPTSQAQELYDLAESQQQQKTQDDERSL